MDIMRMSDCVKMSATFTSNCTYNVPCNWPQYLKSVITYNFRRSVSANWKYASVNDKLTQPKNCNTELFSDKQRDFNIDLYPYSDIESELYTFLSTYTEQMNLNSISHYNDTELS